MYLLVTILLSAVITTSSADESEPVQHPKVEVLLIESQQVEGVTRPEAQPLGCGPGPLLYAHRKPFFRISPEDVAKCTVVKEVANVFTKEYRYRVDVKLTAKAQAELMRRFQQFKSTKWWTVSVDGKVLSSEKTFHQTWTEFPAFRIKTFKHQKEAVALQKRMTR
jgi:hypothetical protein